MTSLPTNETCCFRQVDPISSAARKGRQSFGWECLQVARSLSIACVMDQKVALLRAQAALGKRRMHGLVEDVKGPLSALTTLGGLLTPRLTDNAPEQVRCRPQAACAQPDELIRQPRGDRIWPGR